MATRCACMNSHAVGPRSITGASADGNLSQALERSLEPRETSADISLRRETTCGSDGHLFQTHLYVAFTLVLLGREGRWGRGKQCRPIAGPLPAHCRPHCRPIAGLGIEVFSVICVLKKIQDTRAFFFKSLLRNSANALFLRPAMGRQCGRQWAGNGPAMGRHCYAFIVAHG